VLPALVAKLQPTMLLHGHVLPCDASSPDRALGRTAVRNVFGRHLIDISPATSAEPSRPGVSHAR
jgi:hypothetical protein